MGGSKYSNKERFSKNLMDTLRKLSPPTLEEVRKQWQASANHDYRHRYDNIWSIDSKGRKVVR